MGLWEIAWAWWARYAGIIALVELAFIMCGTPLVWRHRMKLVRKIGSLEAQLTDMEAQLADMQQRLGDVAALNERILRIVKGEPEIPDTTKERIARIAGGGASGASVASAGLRVVKPEED